MTESTRDTGGAAAAARYLKDLERRIQSNEEDLRGDQTAVPLERTVRLGLELEAGPLIVRHYDADSVRLVEGNWDDLARRTKVYRLRDNHSPTYTTTSPAVTTNAMTSWVGPALEPGASAPALDRLTFGTGEGRWRSSDDELHGDPEETVTLEATQRRIDNSRNARATYLVDHDELNGLTFSEHGVESRDGEFLATHGPLVPDITKSADEILRIEMPIAFNPVVTSDGTLTQGFRRWMAYQSLTQSDRRPPLTTASVGTTFPDEASEAVTIVPGAAGEVPVADWSYGIEGSPMLTIAIDATRLNGNTLRAFGITNDDPRSEYRLHSLARIDPPIEKTNAKSATINTIIDIDHAINDLDRVDVTMLPESAAADVSPQQDISAGVGAAVIPYEASAVADAERPGVGTGFDANTLPGRARATTATPTPDVTATKRTTQLVDDFNHGSLGTYYDANHSLIKPEQFGLTTYSRSNWPKRGPYSMAHRRNTEVARMASAPQSNWRGTNLLPYYPQRGDEMVVYIMPTMGSPSSSSFRTRFRWGWDGPASNYDLSIYYAYDNVQLRERSNTYGEFELDEADMGNWNAYQVMRVEILWRTNGSFRVRIYDDASDTLRCELTGTPSRYTTNGGGIEFITQISSGYSGNIVYDWVHVKR